MSGAGLTDLQVIDRELADRAIDPSKLTTTDLALMKIAIHLEEIGAVLCDGTVSVCASVDGTVVHESAEEVSRRG